MKGRLLRRVRHPIKRHQGRRVLVVFAHPIRNSFVGACLDQVVATLKDRASEVRVLDLYGLDFRAHLSLDEWQAYFEPVAEKPGLAEHYDALRWAEALVFVYPTWFGAQPAILKGWFDRVWVDNVAFRLPEKQGRLRPMLKQIRSVTVVTTHGSSKWLNSLQGEPGKRVILRGLRSLCHPLTSTRWIAFYGNDTATEPDRRAFLERIAAEI